MYNLLYVLFGQISGIKRSYGLNTYRYELLPIDFFIFILISKCYQHVNIIIIESVRKSSK